MRGTVKNSDGDVVADLLASLLETRDSVDMGGVVAALDAEDIDIAVAHRVFASRSWETWLRLDDGIFGKY